VQQLMASMPAHRGPDLKEDRDLPKYDYVQFMEKYLDGGGATGGGAANGHA
jgi:hypothetical protein